MQPDNICQMNNTSISKFLSLILRPKPEEIGLTLDANGWASIDELIVLADAKGTKLSRPLIESIVADSESRDGHILYRSENGVGLTDAVPAQYFLQ